MESTPQARSLARVLGTFHNVSYYAKEMKAFAGAGLPEYWRAYMIYRSAPMGVVPAGVITATFYNFAPRVAAEAVPSGWSNVDPAGAMALRDRCIFAALERGLGPDPDDATAATAAEAADLALSGIDGVPEAGRPLFAAHAALPIPDHPVMRLWHACTLWREHRGDGHNMALANADLDGIECHVLLAGKGVGNKPTIQKIRGWTPQEWDAAAVRLADRNLIDADGVMTPEGRDLRRDIESATDVMAAAPRIQLGSDASDRLIALVDPLVGRLIESGVVVGKWPPPERSVPSS